MEAIAIQLPVDSSTLNLKLNGSDFIWHEEKCQVSATASSDQWFEYINWPLNSLTNKLLNKLLGEILLKFFLIEIISLKRGRHHRYAW